MHPSAGGSMEAFHNGRELLVLRYPSQVSHFLRSVLSPSTFLTPSACMSRNRKSMPNHLMEAQVVIPQPVEQSIFYTAYKSEMYAVRAAHTPVPIVNKDSRLREIRYELGTHGSALEYIEDQLIFPSPPTLGQASLDHGDSNENDNGNGYNNAEEAATWYFYLSDIAARHLINRIINVGVHYGRYGTAPDGPQVRALLRDYRVFKSQLEDWYQSLPVEISFPKPSLDEPVEASTQFFSSILRARYQAIRELICRPFMRLCLNYHMDLPDSLLNEIASIASLGLQNCILKLNPTINVVWRHQGGWIGIRNGVSCSMLLIGAARSNRFPGLNAATRMLVPDDWREVVTSFMGRVASFEDESQGGVRDCIQLVRHALADFPDAQ